MNNNSTFESLIDEVLAANATYAEECKASKGKANPAQVNDMLKQKLG